MEKMHSQVRVDNTLSRPFIAESELKQRDELSPIIFNIILEKVVRKLQRSKGGMSINHCILQLLDFWMI